jgi:hypothetical protein
MAGDDYDAGYGRGRERARRELEHEGKEGIYPLRLASTDDYDRGYERGWNEVVSEARAGRWPVQG